MTSIKGTKTEQNLLKSFAGESQAKNRYTFFAKQAKKEGYEKVRIIFEETAEQEGVHAKTMFKHLEGGMVEITAMYPAGKIGTTLENLKASASGENEEHTELYPEFARIAKEEGFPKIANMYRNIAIAEKHHEERFNKLIEDMESESMFQKPKKVVWRCLKCGFVYEGEKAPKMCPACFHPTSWFEEVNTGW